MPSRDRDLLVLRTQHYIQKTNKCNIEDFYILKLHVQNAMIRQNMKPLEMAKHSNYCSLCGGIVKNVMFIFIGQIQYYCDFALLCKLLQLQYICQLFITPVVDRLRNSNSRPSACLSRTVCTIS